VACDALLVPAEGSDGAPSLEPAGFVAVPLVAVPEPVSDFGAPVDCASGALEDVSLVAGAGVVVESDADGEDEGASPLFASRPVPLPPQLVSTVAARVALPLPARAAPAVLAAVGFGPAGPSPPQSA